MNDPRFEIFPERHPGSGDAPGPLTGQFAWHFRAANGEIVATGAEAYTRREDASRAIHEFLDAVYAGWPSVPHPPIIDLDLRDERTS